MDKFVLWGFHPAYKGLDGKPYIIRLAHGSLRECRSEKKYREGLGLWTLGIYDWDTDPATTALQIEFEKAGHA